MCAKVERNVHRTETHLSVNSFSQRKAAGTPVSVNDVWCVTRVVIYFGW
jgi:hypothetical protein